MSKKKGLFDSESSDSDVEEEAPAPKKTTKKKAKVVKKKAKAKKEVKKVEKKEVKKKKTKKKKKPKTPSSSEEEEEEEVKEEEPVEEEEPEPEEEEEEVEEEPEEERHVARSVLLAEDGARPNLDYGVLSDQCILLNGHGDDGLVVGHPHSNHLAHLDASDTHCRPVTQPGGIFHLNGDRDLISQAGQCADLHGHVGEQCMGDSCVQPSKWTKPSLTGRPVGEHHG